MNYTSPLNRRLRALRRLGYAAVQRPMWRGGSVVPSFWWDGHPNFGDDMTPWLLPRYGVLPIYRQEASARLVGVGSILDFLPSTYDGAIWGSGLIEGREHALPHARVLALRGPLTADLIGAANTVPFGDPGLLVGRQMKRPRVRWEVGIIPHGHHRGHARLIELGRDCGDRVRVINVRQGAAAATREIAACGTVFTTSLHGLVVADAFGIPAAWTTLEPALIGGDFKFRDYEAAVTPGHTRFLPLADDLVVDEIVLHAGRADAGVVAGLSTGLERAIHRIAAVLGPQRAFPAGASQLIRN